MFAPQKILVPTDFSEFSDKALRLAIDIAKQYKAVIYLFHAIEPVQQCVEMYCLTGRIVESLREAGLQSSRELMEAQINRVDASKSAEIMQDVTEGSPYREILDEQKAKGIDLIVIASHGHTGIISHFGSVTDSIARGAECPVLIAKGK